MAGKTVRLKFLVGLILSVRQSSLALTGPHDCVVTTTVGTFDLALLGVVRHTTSAGWTYLFSACSNVDARSASASTCSSLAPSPAVQATGGACHALGNLDQRTFAPLVGSRMGVTITFRGGDSCGSEPRRISIDAGCADVERATTVQITERACAYTAIVESRAGCPLACARDPKTGAVCGGRQRGTCTADASGSNATCVCAQGYEGLLCGPTKETTAAAATAAAEEAAKNTGVPERDMLSTFKMDLAPDDRDVSGTSISPAVTFFFFGAMYMFASRRCLPSDAASFPNNRFGGARGVTAFVVLGALYTFEVDSKIGFFHKTLSAPSGGLVLSSVSSSAGTGAATGCTVRPQRLALFNAVPYHTDVFGFLLDFCRDCNHSCVVYHGATAYSALPAYSRYYTPLELRDAARFDSEHLEFAAVFMITPNDHALSAEMRQAEVHRFIYVTHLTEPGLVMRWMLLRIYTTPLAGVPYALPFFAGLTPVPAAGRERSVVFVGGIHGGENILLSDMGAVSGLLVDLGYTVTLFASYIRASDAEHAAFRSNGGAKATIREGASTEELHETVGRASFMLIFPNDVSWYVTDRVTGAHLMAVGLGTPILTTSRFASIYGYSPEVSGTLSGGSPTQMAEAIAMYDSPAKYARLVAAASEYRTRQVLHNREAIESVLKYVPGVGGGGSATLPLSENLKQRVVPRKGDP